MSKDLDTLLDKCIDRINSGESLEECLASYPEQAKELEPLLRAVWDFRDACSPIPKPTARTVARQRLDAALVSSDKGAWKRERRPVPLFGWSRVWAAVAIALVLALIGFGLQWVLTPGTAPVVAQANFRLLLSDDENAIGDFESLKVTITSIGMLRGGESGGWKVIELEEDIVADLTRLQGLNAQEIWSGIIPKGQYIQVFIYIKDAIGTLRNGETVNVIVPSGNLQISKPFAITTDNPVVNFVHDITVVTAGNDYILLPQVDESGANQAFHEVSDGKLTLWVVEGTATPGESIIVKVTFQGDPMPGAQIKVNGVNVGNTSGEAGQEGRISFTVPYDEKLKIKAKIKTAQGELEGELKIHFGDELTLEIVDADTLQVIDDDDITPGQSVKVLVTFEEEPVEGATVTVEDVGVFTTDNDGLTIESFTVPDEDELEIKAVKGDLKGKLETELEED